MQEGTPIIIKKKKHGHEGHHGGAWKVAYADFVTAMMAFFLVMWIMGLSEDTRTTIAGYFNDPFGFMKNTPHTQVNLGPQGMPYRQKAGNGGRADSLVREDMQELTKIEGELKESMKGKGGGGKDDLKAVGLADLAKSVEIAMTSEGLEINFVERTGEVFFELGSANVLPLAKELILKVAPILGKSKRAIRIQGHTDARPYAGANGYDNYDLSGDRARAVYDLLRDGGVSEKQIEDLEAHADKMLRNPEDPYHFSNRRVTVLLPYAAKVEKIYGTPKDKVGEDIAGQFQPPDITPPKPQIAPPNP